jgi:hypothetical protein
MNECYSVMIAYTSARYTTPMPALFPPSFPLLCRGMIDHKTGKPWLDYPYAADGLDVWSELSSYFDTYLRLYYRNDREVLQDPELQAWWEEVKVRRPGVPRALVVRHARGSLMD